MADTVPIPPEPFAAAVPVRPPPLPLPPVQVFAPPPAPIFTIRFGGSGSEYFRIWIVNLLLTLVTVGFYLPWAKVRRLRYFYGNTEVGGHPLDFHGDPKRMLRGFLLVGALLLLYSIAGRISVTAGLVAFVIVACVWPALFRAGQQFRMANTSWRGLRFRFNGDLAGAYRAMLPLFLPGLLMLGAVLLAGDPAHQAAAEASSPTVWLILIAMLASFLMFPLLLWMLKKYQHGHFAIGQVQTDLRIGAGSFYVLALKTFGVCLLTGLVVGIVAGILGSAGVLVAVFGGQSSSLNKAEFIFAIVAFTIGVYGLILLVVVPYTTSRMQNLAWSGTQSPEVRFESTLRFWPLLGLTLKNWVLMLLTLGLYWPFAKVAMTRLRLEAMTLHMQIAPDDLFGVLSASSNDASGDAAGDFFGIDIGW